MNQRIKHLIAAVAVTGATACMAADPVLIANVVELSGGGASAGTQWRDGAELAKNEINQAGGILGRPILLTNYDTQTNPGISKAQMSKALDDKPYAVLGTIYSSSTIVNMQLAKEAEIPQFVGAQAAEITQAGNPYVFRLNMGQQFGIPKVVSYMRDGLGAKRVAAIYVGDSMGRGGIKVFLDAAKKSGVNVVAEVPTEVSQIDFTAAIRAIRNSNADAVFVYLQEEESARFLRAARQGGLQLPLVGETTLLSQRVIDLAGVASNGAQGYVPLTADAPLEPVRKFRSAFETKYKYAPAHAAMQGYIALYLIKAVTEDIGKFDSKALAKRLHGLTLSAEKHPGILITSRWDENGDVERQTFMMEVKNGKQVATKAIPAEWERK